DRPRIDSRLSRERRPHDARRIPWRVADLLARVVLRPGDAGALEPIEALRRVGIDDHHRFQVRAFTLRDERGREVGDAKLGNAGADFLRRQRGAFAELDREVDPGLAVPTLLL